MGSKGITKGITTLNNRGADLGKPRDRTIGLARPCPHRSLDHDGWARYEIYLLPVRYHHMVSDGQSMGC
jgi:hypothetical protein